MSSLGRKLSGLGFGLVVAATMMVAGQSSANAAPCGVSKDDGTPKLWHANNCAPQISREVLVHFYSKGSEFHCVPPRTLRSFGDSHGAEWTGRMHC